MQFLPLLIALLLGLLALAFVLYPIYRRDPTKTKPEHDPEHANAFHSYEDQLNRPKTLKTTQLEGEQVAGSALQEVELDYQLGNITETDYRSLRERYMRRALVTLKTRYDREQELDRAIEEELRQMKENDDHAAP